MVVNRSGAKRPRLASEMSRTVNLAKPTVLLPFINQSTEYHWLAAKKCLSRYNVIFAIFVTSYNNNNNNNNNVNRGNEYLSACIKCLFVRCGVRVNESYRHRKRYRISLTGIGYTIQDTGVPKTWRDTYKPLADGTRRGRAELAGVINAWAAWRTDVLATNRCMSGPPTSIECRTTLLGPFQGRGLPPCWQTTIVSRPTTIIRVDDGDAQWRMRFQWGSGPHPSRVPEYAHGYFCGNCYFNTASCVINDYDDWWCTPPALVKGSRAPSVRSHGTCTIVS